MNCSNYLCGSLVAIFLGGCSAQTQALFDGPALTPVGSGISDSSALNTVATTYPQPAQGEGGWQGGPADYFRDARAKRRGDMITIKIAVNDQATLNNSSNHSRQSQADTNTTYSVGMFGLAGAGTGDAKGGGNSTASGQGSVVRSEKLNISVAAIVREVLPNGFFLITGSQEILVNMERRDVKISGIVDPRNIASDGTIDYSKIAEARVYYGGSGKVSEMQKPNWGMQLWDKITPF
jgi:flagellar L-ring protein precursor FlgH